MDLETAGVVGGAVLAAVGGPPTVRAIGRWLAKRIEKREQRVEEAEEREAKRVDREDTASHRLTASLEERIAKAEERLDRCEERHEECEKKNDACEQRLSDVRADNAMLVGRVDTLQAEAAHLEARLARVERRTTPPGGMEKIE